MAGATMAIAQSEPSITTCEYWFDYGFDSRISEDMATKGTLSKTFDVSSMSKGVHSIGIRFGDNQGLWTSPFIKHFVIPKLPPQTFEGNKITRIDHWTDYDYENRKSAVPSNGNVAMVLDVSNLTPGVHSLAYQAVDERGFISAPFVKHFVIPTQAQPEAEKITAYEYWFNYGPRVRVDVDPQTPLELKDLIIEIKDVVPVKITKDYTFDVETEMVMQPDDVFFGIQAFNNIDVASEAMLSDKFALDVPVNPNVVTLEHGIAHNFVNRGTGTIQGFKVNSISSDSITLSITSGGQLDLYDDTGNAIKASSDTDGFGNTVYSILPIGNVIYALLWNVPVSISDMQIVYETATANGINYISIPTGVNIHSGKGWMSVTTDETCHINIVSVQGTTVTNGDLVTGTTTYHLPSGVYIMRFNDNNIVKVIIK